MTLLERIMGTIQTGASITTGTIKNITGPQGKDIRLVISDKNWLESAAVEQLVKTTELEGIRCGVGMPDLHPGKGQPIGAAFISQGLIYPHLVGSDIGCGMALWKLNINSRKAKLDKWEKRLEGLDDEISKNELNAIKYRLPVTHSLAAGGVDVSHYDDHNIKLGTIGGGNHFAELQTIVEIYDEKNLSQTGIEKNDAVMLVHSGSRGLGQAILREHIDNFGAKGLLFSSKIGQQYISKHDYANRWAVLNRNIIAQRFMDCLSVKANHILDISHNHVLPLNTKMTNALGYQEKHGSFWIHRKGASPVDRGFVMIPGSRGSLSYLVKPCNDIDQLAYGGFSLAHGAGRKWKRSDAKGRLENRYSYTNILKTRFSSRVICNNKDLAYEEAPQAYKDIDLVVHDLVEANMIEVVASFKPLLTYKTKRRR